MTQHRGVGSCPLSSLLKATNSSLSSHDSSLLCPPSTRAQSEWLQTRFCVLALEEGTLSPADSRHSLAERIPLVFTARYYEGTFSWLRCPGMGVQHGVETPSLLRCEPLQLRYPSRISVFTCGSRASPVQVSAFPTSLDVASSVNT